jgi:hypothetical protein
MAERPELGFSATNLLNPWELRHAACESFLKLIKYKGYEQFKNSLVAVLHEQPQYGNSEEQYYK